MFVITPNILVSSIFDYTVSQNHQESLANAKVSVRQAPVTKTSTAGERIARNIILKSPLKFHILQLWELPRMICSSVFRRREVQSLTACRQTETIECMQAFEETYD